MGHTLTANMISHVRTTILALSLFAVVFSSELDRDLFEGNSAIDRMITGYLAAMTFDPTTYLAKRTLDKMSTRERRRVARFVLTAPNNGDFSDLQFNIWKLNRELSRMENYRHMK